MCKSMIQFYLNAKSLDWLAIKLPNPYAFVYDKLNFALLFLFLAPLIFIVFFHNQVPCSELLMIISGISFFLGIIRGIKTVPADAKEPIIKAFTCYQLILVKIFILVFLYKGIVCLTT